MSDERREKIHDELDRIIDQMKLEDDSSFELKVIVKSGGVADRFVQVSRRI